ncbi:uncharacterized protein LDX57_011553 [Aspergillus melleus]|uniref:uncharacterized protein n=1 Tax=Aspergillus melleus TaxID=138277 RepID=UPI001E8EABE2|nr:uncharacterized protein LDX57_011553 [Aspergillus melleus]KAH8433917.1 hypothetical protein LDX57_011553 [Aspergillus melleus]
MIIVCGSIPPIRPLFGRLFGSRKRTPPSSNVFAGGDYSEFSSEPSNRSHRLKRYIYNMSGGLNTGLSDSASDTQILQSRVEVEAKGCMGKGHGHGHQEQEFGDSTRIVRMTDIVIETTSSRP